MVDQSGIKPRTHTASFVSILASVLMSGLAAGALWCLLSLQTDRDTAILIVPLAAAIGFFMRWQRLRGGVGAWCASTATLLAFAYAQYLFAAIRIAQILGFSLRKTLFRMDFALALQVGRANITGWDIGWLALALIVAGGVAWPRPDTNA